MVGRGWVLLAVVAAVATLFALPVTFSVFSGGTDAPTSLQASAYFPKVPEQVATDQPYAYYRGEDPVSGVRPAAPSEHAGVRAAAYNGPSNGPVLWYPLRESSGSTRVLDYSGAVNTGTVNGAAAVGSTAGHSGSGLTLAGATADDYLSSAYQPVHTNRSFSVMAWVYLTDAAGNRAVLSQSNPGGRMSAYILKWQSGASPISWQFYLPQTDVDSPTVDIAYLTSTIAAAQGAWYHVAGVFDAAASRIYIYVNGVAGTSRAHTAAYDATGPLWVGRSLYNGNATDRLPGRVDDVRIYQRALSQTEVQQIAGIAPASHYRLEETTAATIAADSGGENNPATRVGATQVAGQTGFGAKLSATGYLSAGGWGVDTTAGFTVSAWVNLTATTGTRAVVSQSGNLRPGFVLGLDGGAFRFAMARDDTAGAVLDQVISSVAPGTGIWTHLAGVFDAATGALTIHVGGVATGGGVHTSTWPAAGPLQIGRVLANGVGIEPLNDTVDEVQLYGWAMSAAEVNTIRTAGSQTAMHATERVKPITAAARGALQGSEQGLTASTAMAFAGYTNAYATAAVANVPAASTVSCWFRSTSAGALAGFQSVPTGGASADYADRALYLDSGGQLSFGVLTSGGARVSVRSTAVLNDGAWHHAAAVVGPGGTRLYVDGLLAAANANTSTRSTGAGHWRWGGASLSGWPNRPPNDYLIGSVDELAIFHHELTAQQVSWQFHADH